MSTQSTSNQPKIIYVEKNFRQVACGTITETKDVHGNQQFFIDRTVDNQQFTFWTRSAGEHWLRLGGLLHG